MSNMFSYFSGPVSQFGNAFFYLFSSSCLVILHYLVSNIGRFAALRRSA